MKTKIKLLAAFIVMIVCNAPSVAQTVNSITHEKQLQADTSARIISFTGRYYSGKTYLKWTTIGQQKDGIYLIYRSTDGVNYENIGSKQGVGVPISKEIAYYFVDDKCNEPGIKQYRLIHVNTSHSYLISTCTVERFDNTAVAKTE